MTLALALFTTAGLPAVAKAASPAWDLSLSSQPTTLAPGATSTGIQTLPQYFLLATNIGGAPTSGPITFSDTLPAGLTPTTADFGNSGTNQAGSCTIAAQAVSCTYSATQIRPGQSLQLVVTLDVGPALLDGDTVLNSATVTGGGAPSAEAQTTTTISSTPAPFGFLPGPAGFRAAITDPDGQPVTQAGSHPSQLTVNLGLNSVQSEDDLVGAGGGIRDTSTALPPGFVVNPSATSVLCTEAELETDNVPGGGCPSASQVGIAGIITTGAGTGTTAVFATPLYNMVPPPGAPASLGFDAVNVGIYVHILGGVRGGDYALTATSTDVLARNGNPVLGVQVQLWGDPSHPRHDGMRCAFGGQGGTPCPPVALTPQQTPFLTMPTSCSDSLLLEASADSWLDPGNFVSTQGNALDSHGNLTGVSGCDQVPFDPTIDLQPTTARADSPSGMDVSLEIPQPQDHDQLASAHLKRAVVTLPEGMSMNPSAADGLAGCTTDQIGLTNDSPIRFDLEPPSCPDASKVGSATIHTPLLPDPLDAELFLADQDDNPFDALLSGYLVAQGHGLVIKIAGEFETDPDTGQIKAIFNNNPQAPFDEVELHFKGGSRGVIITPPTCGIWTISSQLSPWSAADPENPTPAETVDDVSTFVVDKTPSGGGCVAGDPSQPGDPADRADLPFGPEINAGTVHPIAGAHSPFVLRLTRSDGEQEITRLSADLPPGLVGKLAGIAQCPDATLAAIPTALGTGQGELNSPSCPAGSKIGHTNVGAGAGSQLTYIPGQVYLAGPYDPAGPSPLAPLSIAVVTPALAGPFDLGNVVVRTALYVDQDDAQIHAVSDPLPTILHGIPAHIRDIRIVMDRQNFTLNPTNCNPMAITGSAGGAGASLANPADDTSAAVSDRFQVSGCAGLDFKPRMTLRLRGGTKRGKYPALTTTIMPRPGDANIASVSLALPRSEFLANEHIRTVCTRPDFAADACPAGAIYGKATVQTPLLDDPLTGHAYLRSSNNLLPDLVTDLRGPASLPIKLETSGRTDSVRGGIRSTFDFIPDAPFSKATVALRGGSKGLLVNSRHICKRTYRAVARYTAHNGDTFTARPKLRAQCKNKRGKKRKGKRRGHRRAALSAPSRAR